MIDSDKFSVFVTYSDVDECFIAVCFEYPGISAYGDTRVEAVEEIETAIDLLTEQLEVEGKDMESVFRKNELDTEEYGEFLESVFKKTEE